MASKIDSRDVPQADLLDDVVRVAEAVQQGAQTYSDIANYIDKVDRQGRYYRRAAEILGLVENTHNHSNLTNFGKEFLRATSSARHQMLQQAVLNAPIFQRIIPFLELYPKGVSKDDLEDFLSEVTTHMEDSMVSRRVLSIISWLIELGLLKKISDTTYLLLPLPKSVPIIEVQNLSEPLFPQTGALKEYQTVEERTMRAKEEIVILMNEAAKERANNSHIHLVNLVADRIRASGSIPRCNKLIDLSTRRGDMPYIFEMKSITDMNARSQIRHGISQLYEYRFLQAMPEATLILVIEKPLPNELNWMNEYLEKDRQVRLIWNGDNKLNASAETKAELSYLWTA